MVIVIDLEEEEAKKAAEAAAAAKQTTATASPNGNGSGQPGGDKNGKSGKKPQPVPTGPQHSKGKPDIAGGEGAAAGVAESPPTQKSSDPDTKRKEDTVKDSKPNPQQPKSMPAETNPSKGRDGKAGKDSKS
ncbi:collagen alpha-1(I) chain-like [Haliotis rubra]|uniref:collagen alpha-1(I) chain-like n=1 Tax=Haliotis rubra TaxID=36100 RepID=UPI001EE4FC33|nr:collagen alpha-1(I) chain-like [Haliotis rubra]XP_046550734.1 collagen alpha-1(I) chain-like [Haliotis rubra]